MTQSLAGTYPARITNYGIQSTGKGDPKVFVEFQVMDHEAHTHRVFWSGGFYSQAGTEITIKNLMTMGLKSAEDIPRMADGMQSRALDPSLKIELNIEQKPHWKEPGRMVPEVKYINPAGTSRPGNVDTRMDAATAASKLASLSLGAAFQKVQEKQQISQPIPGAPQYSGSLDDLPF